MKTAPSQTDGQGARSLHAVVMRGVARDKNGHKRPKGWLPHVLDELSAPELRAKTIAAGMFAKLTDKSPEAKAIRKRRGKLAKIMRLENEACGEEGW